MVEQLEQPFTAEWVANASVQELVSKCTDAKTPPDKLDFYQLVHLELVDRMKENKSESQKLTKELNKYLKDIDNSVRQQQLI